jgi:hypothetical protein
MRRCLERICAGLLLCAAIGCIDGSFLNRQIVVYGPKVVVPGSVSEVAAKLRDGLSDAGLAVNTKSMGADYRISSVWKNTVFCLHLKQSKDASGGTTTMIRMQWDRGGNDELWQLIQKILNTPADNGGDVSTAKGSS